MQLKTLGKFFKVWYPSLLIAIIIFIFSASSSDVSDRQSGFIINAIKLLFPSLENADFLVTLVRKGAHFTEYALLGYFTARAFRLSQKSPLYSILACAVYAATDEFHQSFVSGRSAEVKDVVLDTAGASFGVGIYLLFHHRKN